MKSIFKTNDITLSAGLWLGQIPLSFFNFYNRERYVDNIAYLKISFNTYGIPSLGPLIKENITGGFLLRLGPQTVVYLDQAKPLK